MIAQFWLFHVNAELISNKNMYNLPHFRNGLCMQNQLQNARFFGEGWGITALHTCTLNAILLKNYKWQLNSDSFMWKLG